MQKVIDIQSHRRFVRGCQHLAAGQIDQSIKLFNTALDAGDEAEKYNIYLSRGVANLLLHDYDAALTDFDAAQKADKSQYRTYFYRGLVHKIRYEIDAAIEHFSRAIMLKPDYGPAYVERAGLFADVGDEERSRYDLRMAVIFSESQNLTATNETGINDGGFNKAMSILEREAEVSTVDLKEDDFDTLHRQCGFYTTH